MKKVLVIGEADRVREFKRLELKHAEVTFHEYASIETMDVDWNSPAHIGEDGDEGDDEEDDLVFGEEEQDDETLLFSEEDDDDDEETWLFDEDEDEFGADGLPTEDYDIIFDLNFDDEEDGIVRYMFNEGQVVFACAVKRTLAEMVGGSYDMDCKVFGMNALPTFIDRPKLEISMLDRADHMTLEATLKTLGLEYELIEDQVGMVTPRVVCMIINEAAFVLGEGTATVEAVDQAMKLGTNYPKGPFEWCDAIGIFDVVEVIEALHKASGDGKYKLAPALRRHRDLELRFYPEK